MAIGPTIETDRLILRPPRAEDFDSWVAFHGDAEVMEHLGGVQGPELTWRSICTMTGAWAIRGFSMFSVIEKATGSWVGRLGPWQPAGWPGTEVGWGLARGAWGKGYATEAARAMIGFAFRELDLPRLFSIADPRNKASTRVMERLGMRSLGLQRHYGTEAATYVLDRP